MTRAAILLWDHQGSAEQPEPVWVDEAVADAAMLAGVAVRRFGGLAPIGPALAPGEPVDVLLETGPGWRRRLTRETVPATVAQVAAQLGMALGADGEPLPTIPAGLAFVIEDGHYVMQGDAYLVEAA